MENINYRIANKKDVKKIIEIIRIGNEEFLDKIIYGCKGIEAYVESNIKNDNDLKFFVATKDEYVIGALEIKLIEDTIFINYIAIDPEQRGNGIGKNIIKYSIKYLMKQRKYSKLGLDVFKHNSGALKLYKNLGFRIIKEYEWISILNYEKNFTNISYDLVNYKKSMEMYNNRGFSNLTIRINNEEKNVGILGEKWFRVRANDINNNLISILSNIDNRNILLIKEKCMNMSKIDVDINSLYNSYRMETTIEEILNKL